MIPIKIMKNLAQVYSSKLSQILTTDSTASFPNKRSPNTVKCTVQIRPHDTAQSVGQFG